MIGNTKDSHETLHLFTGTAKDKDNMRENFVHCHCSVNSSTSEEEDDFEAEDQTKHEQTEQCQNSAVTNEGSLINSHTK